ncbi:hypothetical protein ROHU_033322 [Labeo rohita]|uniref:Uncharacterized protein n=1 Tax=Labeo rohita TaxID=84645 RepID=A0A498LBB2_LABRO|nr:hypothetical protein ROHU_033322 [Labeo rohita]
MVPFLRRINGVRSEGRASRAAAECHERSRIDSSDTELWDPTGISSDLQTRAVRTVTLLKDLGAFQRLRRAILRSVRMNPDPNAAV